jgi:hypothetical protein
LLTMMASHSDGTSHGSIKSAERQQRLHGRNKIRQA